MGNSEGFLKTLFAQFSTVDCISNEDEGISRYYKNDDAINVECRKIIKMCENRGIENKTIDELFDCINDYAVSMEYQGFINGINFVVMLFSGLK